VLVFISRFLGKQQHIFEQSEKMPFTPWILGAERQVDKGKNFAFISSFLASCCWVVCFCISVVLLAWCVWGNVPSLNLPSSLLPCLFGSDSEQKKKGLKK
jgi:hypothetical protein